MECISEMAQLFPATTLVNSVREFVDRDIAWLVGISYWQELSLPIFHNLALMIYQVYVLDSSCFPCFQRLQSVDILGALADYKDFDLLYRHASCGGSYEPSANSGMSAANQCCRCC